MIRMGMSIDCVFGFNAKIDLQVNSILSWYVALITGALHVAM